MKNIIYGLLLGLLIAGCDNKQHYSKMDTYLDTLEKNNAFMGNVSISRNGKEFYSKSVGFKSVENNIKNTHQTQFCIGSISKSFTAALIFKAQEEGLVDINTTLDNYFPDVPNSKIITLDQMLSHQSGIYNFTDSNFSNWNTKNMTRHEILDIIYSGKPSFDPGVQIGYSNTNYVLLSYILEDIYKKSFSEILKIKITDPLKLEGTYFGSKTDNLSDSYNYSNGWKMQGYTSPSVAIGAGSIISTADDLNKFYHSLFNEEIVSSLSLSKMIEFKNNTGRGLFVFPFYDKLCYGHTGGIDGFNSISLYFPEDKVGYTSISNGLNFNMNDITIAMLSDVYNKDYEIPVFNTNIVLTSADLDKYLGVYSCEQLPIKLTFTKKHNVLIGQGTNQPPFYLECFKENSFKYTAAGIVIEFNPENNTLVLKQGGGAFLMKRE